MLNYLRVAEDVDIIFALYVVIDVFLFSVLVEPLEVLIVFVLLEQVDGRSNSSLVVVKRYDNLMMWISLLYQLQLIVSYSFCPDADSIFDKYRVIVAFKDDYIRKAHIYVV